MSGVQSIGSLAAAEPIEPASPCPPESAEHAERSELETGPELGVWQLAWPTIIGNLLFSTVGLVDMKIVGSLGASAVAAVGTGSRVFFVLQAVLMAITAGTTTLVARAWGAGDRQEAARVTRASFLLCTALALVLMVPAFVFADTLVRLFRLDEETMQQAASFIRWISLFSAAFAISAVLSTALRAAGDVRTPLWVGALTNVVNVVLVYSLVYGKLGFPRMGVAGAAIASGCAFSTGAVVLLVLWLRGRLLVRYSAGPVLTRERVRRLVHIGYPAALEQAVWQGGFLAFLWIVSLYGTKPFAAYNIGVSILAFSFVVGFGFSMSASTLVGQHLGARDPAGAARSGWRAMRLAVAAMSVLGFAIVAGSHAIASFMIDDPEVVRLTVFFIYVLGAVQPLMAIEFAVGGALRGAGDTRFPLVAVATGLLGVRVLLAVIFAWQGLGVEWIFAALIGDYIVKVAMLTLRFRGNRWKHAVPDLA
jgi:putative MATE family efflux protein